MVEGSESPPGPDRSLAQESPVLSLPHLQRPGSLGTQGPSLWGHGAVLTGAGGGRWVQHRPVVAEVAAAGLGSRGCRVAVGRAAGTELVPGG